MTLNAASFKGRTTSFGIFYPTGYVLSVFRTAADADGAAVALRATGFTPDDLVPASGSEVLAFSHELRSTHGRVNAFERFVSQHYGDEADAADELVDLAKSGNSFLATYAPDDAATARAADATRAFAPVVLRKFEEFTFTDLR